jgi:hypothetical protein
MSTQPLNPEGSRLMKRDIFTQALRQLYGRAA